MKSIKTALSAAILSLTAMTAIAQEQWVIEFNDGTQSAFNIDNIKQMSYRIYTPEKGSGDQEHGNTPSSTSVTGGVCDITAVSATMQGYVNNVKLGDATYAGICYSPTNTTPTTSDPTLTTWSTRSGQSYSIIATQLVPATTYYYRAYVCRGGLVQYAAETFSFTTPSTDGIVTTGAASDITSIHASISSSFNLPPTAYSIITRGVCYSATNASPTTSDATATVSDSFAGTTMSDLSDGNYSVSLTELNSSTLYYYRSYIIVDNRTIYGETRSFTTNVAGTSSTIAVTGTISRTVDKSPTDVTCTANIGSLDFSTIILGVCWSATHTTPTLNDNTATTRQIDADSKYVVTMSRLKENSTYYYRAYIKTDKDIYYGDVLTFKTAGTFHYEYVEIGGLKWATMNLGATTVAGSPSTCYGDYYAWGETEPRYTSLSIRDASSVCPDDWKDGYSEGYSDYPRYRGATLDAEHDAATQNWCPAWRTPTDADFRALINACLPEPSSCTPTELSTSTPAGGIYWLSSSQNFLSEYKGVAGMLFIDQTDTSKRVFFPATGLFSCFCFMHGGLSGCYWSSSLNTYTRYTNQACAMSFKSSIISLSINDERYLGFTIRPVSD